MASNSIESPQVNGGARHLVRFGVFEADLVSGELRKQGVRVRIQGKPFQVLRALLENPGTVITREELRHRLWADDTFVDFESGLNTAANRLRLTLGDSADSPRYIETLARTGYRFIAPVEEVSWPNTVAAAPPPAISHPASNVKWLAAGLLAVSIILLTYLALRRPIPKPARFRQVTFRRGQVGSARFGPDKQSILYTGRWGREGAQLFFTNGVSPESRLLGFPNAGLASVSRLGELALLSVGGTMNLSGGVLSRVPMNGGAPLRVDQTIMAADWSPDGSKLAVVRAIDGVNQLEFPIGKALYRTSGWLGNVRVSPRENAIAFLEHPVRHDDSGSVKLLRTSGEVQTLSPGWASAGGLAWHPSGKEIWFTAAREGSLKSLWAVSMSGKLRAVAQAPGILTLQDVSPDGKALVTRETRRLEIAGLIKGDVTERDLSWLDWSRVQDVSADGKLILFDESGEGAGSRHLVYVHRTDDRTTIRLGEGRALALSPDAKVALTLGTEDRTRFRLVPITGGPARELRPTGLQYQWARFFADGERLLVFGGEHGAGLRLYIQSLKSDGPPKPITRPMMVRNVAISPDGNTVAVLTADGKLALYPTAGGEARILASGEPLAPVHWSQNGEWLFVQHLRSFTEVPAVISKIRVRTGEMTTWRKIAPADLMGVHSITGVAISRDEKSYAYSYRRILSELYVVEGWL